MTPQTHPNLARATLGELLDSIAARTPTPGGGAVASITGALAAALTAMVVTYTLGKPKYAPFEQELNDARQRCTRTRELLLRLAHEDAATYAALNELLALPDNHDRRVAELPAVALAATHVPLAVAATACDHLRLCNALADKTNRMLRSDLAIAATLARAAVDAACCNVMVNLPTLARLAIDRGVREEADALADEARRLEADVRQRCA